MNKSSLTYWFQKIAGLEIPIPKTEIVSLTSEEIQAYLKCGGDSIYFPRLNEQVRKVIRKMFQLPVFLRTDEYSGKHSWKKTCFLDNLDNLDANLARLTEESMSVDFLGALPLQAIVVREFISMDSRFTAFRGEMPVNPERRYFIRNRKIECHHPYWIEDAVAQGTREDKLPQNWRQLAKDMNNESPEEVSTLTEYAQRIASLMPEYWSIDFCKSRARGWILIDMAEGEKSWHPSDCKYSTMPEEHEKEPTFQLVQKKK